MLIYALIFVLSLPEKVFLLLLLLLLLACECRVSYATIESIRDLLINSYNHRYTTIKLQPLCADLLTVSVFLRTIYVLLQFVYYCFNT